MPGEVWDYQQIIYSTSYSAPQGDFYYSSHLHLLVLHPTLPPCYIEAFNLTLPHRVQSGTTLIILIFQSRDLWHNYWQIRNREVFCVGL